MVPKSGWYQNQGGTKIRVVVKSGWYQIDVANYCLTLCTQWPELAALMFERRIAASSCLSDLYLLDTTAACSIEGLFSIGFPIGFSIGFRVVVKQGGKSGWYQTQGGTKIRVVPNSGWYQNQGGTKIRVVVKSGWYQNQGGTKIRVVVKSGW